MKQTIVDDFLALAAIPRPSHHEERVSEYLYRRALDKGLAAHRDAFHNVIIDKPASPGREQAPLVILQAHMDMVMVWEEGKSFDPLRDPVTVVNDGASLRGDGTSLGGDDGAGVALALAILEDKNAVHGPLRAIFTADEEDGMSGANGLDKRWLAGAYMLNLDWEEFGSLCCSSAGSELYEFTTAPVWEKAEGAAYSLRVSGLTGGHSGTAIHLGRLNALRCVSELLCAARREGIPVRLAALAGGSAHNAIPAAAQALLVVPETDTRRFESLYARLSADLRAAHSETDPQAQLSLSPAPLPERTLGVKQTVALSDFMSTIPIGVHTMSAAIPTLVESSANMGGGRLTEKEMRIEVLQRSSEPAVTDAMRTDFRREADAHGLGMTVSRSSPPWPVRPGSALTGLCTETYRRLFGKDMTVEPIHAGLECGSFAQKEPALDIISIGPDIFDIHSPREKLDLDSVEKLYTLVTALLGELSKV